MLTDDELDKIEAAARAATPGPWSLDVWYANGSVDGTPYREETSRCIVTDDGGVVIAFDGVDEMHLPDSAYVAAADPATVLALIAEVRRLRPVRALRVQQDFAMSALRDIAAAFEWGNTPAGVIWRARYALADIHGAALYSGAIEECPSGAYCVIAERQRFGQVYVPHQEPE